MLAVSGLTQAQVGEDAFKKADFGTFSRAAQMEWDKISPKKTRRRKVTS